MKIRYLYLKHYKRLHLANIKEIGIHFDKTVTIIRGISGIGKSSILQEMSPLPSVRTAFDTDGKKEIHITHENNEYVLISDFSNRTSPHSFIRNGVELNLGHTKDIQEDLVVKYLGFTPLLRNLIFYKTKICSLTKTERKNLFLNINPVDFSLMWKMFKEVSSEYRAYESQLKLLYQREAELKGKLLSDDVLRQQVNTRDKLHAHMSELHKHIYVCERNIDINRNEKRHELEYYEQCLRTGTPLIPTDEIRHLSESDWNKYRHIPRNDKLDQVYKVFKARKIKCDTDINNIRSIMLDLRREIDDYQRHLDKVQDKPADVLEHEINVLSQKIESYAEPPKTVISKEVWSDYERDLEVLKGILFVFVQSEVKMRSLDELLSLKTRIDNSVRELAYLGEQQKLIQSNCDALKADLQACEKNTAGIPTGCVDKSCGLRVYVETKRQRALEAWTSHSAKLQSVSDHMNKLQSDISKWKSILEPYITQNLISNYTQLTTILSKSYFAELVKDWDILLLVRERPMQIYKDLATQLALSQQYHEKLTYIQKKQQLEIELEALIKTNGASFEFLTDKINSKTKLLDRKMKTLVEIETKLHKATKVLSQYDEFYSLVDHAKSVYESFNKGMRAISAYGELEFWKTELSKLNSDKTKIETELVELDRVVKEQELITHTYRTEILPQIAKISSDSKLCKCMMTALSPTQGIMYKSMVSFINALIVNVNKFIEQIWSYTLRVETIDLDKELTYELLAEIGSGGIGEIDSLSEGQTEIMNLSWVLAILLQMDKLKTTPLLLDEAGRALDPVHRGKLLDFFNNLILSDYIEQLVLISHYDEFAHGFVDSNVVYITADDIEVPSGANDGVMIVRT